jgi:hypothetical protein
MGDWPKVVKAAIMSMASESALPLPHNVPTEIADKRLAACFQAVCGAAGNLHKAKVIQNLGAASFHLCFLLRVSIPFNSTRFLLPNTH